MKTFTSKCLFALLFSVVSASQMLGQAITITAADIPAPTGPLYYDNITALVTNPTLTANGYWDYSSYFGNTPDFAAYYPETIPFFTDAGVDIYRQGFKYMNANLGYQIYQEYDFNSNGVDDIAMDIVEQHYSLQPLTGGAADSQFIPSQSYIYNQPRRILEFPMTANSAWSSSSRRTVEMIFNVPTFGLNNANVTHAFTLVRKDTIAGWGKARVYTPSGPSIDYDVLIDKSIDYAVDSFYLGGAPAPPALLSAFGVSQGQITQKAYRYNFYRKGSFGYLVGFTYTDDAFSNLQFAFVSTDDIETATASAVSEKISYATVLYPNPCAGSEINVKVMGTHFDIEKYLITDQMGKLVRQGQTENLGDGVKVRLNETLPTGQYYVSLLDKNLRSVVSEKFEVIH